MAWRVFLESVLNDRQYGLTPAEVSVLMCLEEERCLTKNELLQHYVQSSGGNIEIEAFTQRLKNIYKKFDITGKGHKLPQLYNLLKDKHIEYKNNQAHFSEVGLKHIYPKFPRDRFGQAILSTLESDRQEDRCIDILQTFAPNLNDFLHKLILCLRNGVRVRILLAWPYSEAARLRQDVLRKYSLGEANDDLEICDRVLENLESLETIIQSIDKVENLQIRLYDTLPSLAVYRAGHYILAGVFLHGALAINTFQLELDLSAPNSIVAQTLKDDFELMWEVARPFMPHPDTNWRSDLKVLFYDNHYA